MSPQVVWAGLGVAVGGLAMIAVAWGQVAGETQVYLQLPYLASAGLTGLALVMIGVATINASTRARDAHERARQMATLLAILEELGPPSSQNRDVKENQDVRPGAPDPFLSSVAMLFVLTGAGVVSLALAWRGAAATLAVADQLPYLVSGGLGGLALTGFSLGLLLVQHRRYTEARSRADLDQVIAAAAGVTRTRRAGR